MHACGHDIHMTCWVGTARVLAAMKDKWSRHGRVHRASRPRRSSRARGMMLDDGLYKRFPKPDYALALHSDPLNPAGVVAYTEGLALATSDTSTSS